MAVKNSVFRENLVGSKVAGMKTTIFAILDPTWTHILAPKGPNKEFLKEHFSQEEQKLYYYQFCDFNSLRFLQPVLFALEGISQIKYENMLV